MLSDDDESSAYTNSLVEETASVEMMYGGEGVDMREGVFSEWEMVGVSHD